MTSLKQPEPDDRQYALEAARELAELICGDIVLVPFADGRPDLENCTRDALQPFSGHWSEIGVDDIARIGILTDGFGRFIRDAEGISVVTMMRGGTPIVQQIEGDHSELAVDIIADAIIDGTPLQEIQQERRNPGPHADALLRIVADLEAKSESRAPVAANDNTPAKVEEAPTALNIFEWTARRFVGEPDPVEYLVDGVIESGIPGMIAAMGEVGKSYSLLELSRRIAFGSPKYASPIFGGQVVQEGTAVFITGEDDARAMHRRLAALDPNGARLAEKGDKLIVVPMPSAVGAIKPFWRHDRVKGPVETEEWARFVEQLCKIRDLRSVVIDPLQLFAAVPLNEDPAAGQFVCGSVATVAAQLKTNIFFAHHMKKSGREIESLADARDSVRGTTALVDGVRLAYGLWYGDQDKARRTCKTLEVDYAPNRIVLGGVIKANGAARRILSTYARNEFGLLVDKTASLGSSAPAQGDLRAALVITIEAAAASGQPFTKTGATGLFAMRERLPDELRSLSRHRLESLAAEAITRKDVVTCLAGGTVAKWLDVPNGQFATGLGTFRKGMARA